MYFLNGDRIYIKPSNGCRTQDEQLYNCLQQLSEFDSEKKIFKLNFFIDVENHGDYTQVQKKIQNEVRTSFPENILLSIIAQPPLNCKVIVEACFYDPSVWKPSFFPEGENGAVLFENHEAQVLIGNVQSFASQNAKENSEQVFVELSRIFKDTDFPVSSIIRQWNYIEDILGFDGQEQRYQVFNNVRSGFYGTHFEKGGFPAATGIGMNQGGIIIEFFAIKSTQLKSVAINNPLQIAAHSYSEEVLLGEACVLKATPKFERARYIEMIGKKIIFISGTASIVGERTVGVGNPIEQTEITIRNIKQLYSNEVLGNISGESLNPKYGHARVYVKNRKDFSVIRRTFKSHFGNLPVVYIIADICRNDLLVEIEGKVILE